MSVGAGRTVLLVEDDAALRMLCRVNLELDGYRVLEADSVDAAVGQVEADDVDVVILDIRLGDGGASGLALLDRLPHEPAPAVIVLTGSADLSELTRPAGVAAVLSKPFRLEELTQTVHDLAEQAAHRP